MNMTKIINVIVVCFLIQVECSHSIFIIYEQCFGSCGSINDKNWFKIEFNTKQRK